MGALKGVGDGEAVGASVATAAGEAVGVCFETNQDHVAGLKPVLLVLLVVAYPFWTIALLTFS